MDVTTLKELSAKVVSLEEVKTHLRVEENLEDGYLETIIGAAIDFCENYTKRSVKKKQVEIISDHFPKGGVKLPIFPTQEIVKITYQDINEVTKELDSDFYRAILDVEPPIVMPKTSWPNDVLKRTGSVRIKAIVGYEQVPLSMKQAILLLCGHFYENREVMRESHVHGSEIPFSVSALLYPYKVFWW